MLNLSVLARVSTYSTDTQSSRCLYEQYTYKYTTYRLKCKLMIICQALHFAIYLFKDGSTALFKAALKGYNSVVEELLKFSPSLGLLKVEDAAINVFKNRFIKHLGKYADLLFC